MNIKDSGVILGIGNRENIVSKRWDQIIVSLCPIQNTLNEQDVANVIIE